MTIGKSMASANSGMMHMTRWRFAPYLLPEADFFAGGSGSVDGVEGGLELQGFVERDQGFFAFNDGSDEVMDSVFAVREFGNVEVNGFVTVRAIAEHARRIEA